MDVGSFLGFIGGEGYKWILTTELRRRVGANGELRKRMGCRFGKGGCAVGGYHVSGATLEREYTKRYPS